MKLILLLVAAFVAAGIVEHVRHRRSLERLPVRIHVNGTRGKSSVTRLIAAGLRAGGVQTVCKTTGSAARYIHPDGSEEPVQRVGPPNIKEQIAVMRQAVAEGAQALVLECMAVRPDLQAVSEGRVVQSTIGVITNVRPDHLEVMGPTVEGVARALSSTIPRGGRAFTSDATFAPFFREVAAARGSTLSVSDPGSVTEEDLRGFSYVEHAENVSLALDVCGAVGVPRATALGGMYSVTPDIGALTRVGLRRGDRRFEFVNAFAANDPASTVMIWKRLGFHEADPSGLAVLVNLRGDRMRRSKDLAPLLHRDMTAGRYVLVGDQTRLMTALMVRQGVPRSTIVDLGGVAPDRICDELFRLAERPLTIVGIGNIGGVGRPLLEQMEKERDTL
jgi:poly-gamma-glutamate synthase PgsB/CapB